MITININATKIDKSALYEGKNGKYLNLVLFENRDGQDQFGNDGFVTQDLGKARREAGERGPILGNWKNVETRNSAPSRPAQDAHNQAKVNGYQPQAKRDSWDDDDEKIPF